MLVVTVQPDRPEEYQIVGSFDAGGAKIQGRTLRVRGRVETQAIWCDDDAAYEAVAATHYEFPIVSMHVRDSSGLILASEQALRVDLGKHDPTVLPGFEWSASFIPSGRNFRDEEVEFPDSKLTGDLAIIMTSVMETLEQIEMEVSDAIQDRAVSPNTDATQMRRALYRAVDRVNGLRRYLCQITDDVNTELLVDSLLAEKEREIEGRYRRRSNDEIKKARDAAEKKLRDEIDRRFGSWQRAGRREICL